MTPQDIKLTPDCYNSGLKLSYDAYWFKNLTCTNTTSSTCTKRWTNVGFPQSKKYCKNVSLFLLPQNFENCKLFF